MKKKKLLEKDGFYLALFACVCLVAVGGVWFTKNSIDKLASETGFLNHGDDKIAQGNEDEEVHLIKEEDKSVPTSTDSKDNIETAKKENETKNKETTIEKLLPVNGEITRKYSETEPSYSETLEQWEIHKGVDIKAKKGSEVTSIIAGKVIDVYEDSSHGMSVKLESKDKTQVIYSNLDNKIDVKKGDEVKVGQKIGIVGNTSSVESVEGPHLHIEASKENKSINPMDLMK